MFRPELYAFLLPFTLVSLLVYYRVLHKIFICRKNPAFNSFFYQMTWSLAIYDISYIVFFFIMELPQDWPQLYGFFDAINTTIIPQLHWAHMWQCYLAQFSGVTLIALSRMLQLCHPSAWLTKMFKKLSTKMTILLHGLIPLFYAIFVVLYQAPRHYHYHPDANSITRQGTDADNYSIKFNSNVMIVTSTGGAIICAICYFRIFLVLRERPFRSSRQEHSVIVTSFMMFISLCGMCAYYLAYKYLLIAENMKLFFLLRRLTFVVSFFISLVNPWSLFIMNGDIRAAVLGPFLMSLCQDSSVSDQETTGNCMPLPTVVARVSPIATVAATVETRPPVTRRPSNYDITITI